MFLFQIHLLITPNFLAGLVFGPSNILLILLITSRGRAAGRFLFIPFVAFVYLENQEKLKVEDASKGRGSDAFMGFHPIPGDHRTLWRQKMHTESLCTSQHDEAFWVK